MNRYSIGLVFVLCLFSFTLMADLLPEAKTTEATLEEDYKTKVDPFFISAKTGTVKNGGLASQVIMWGHKARRLCGCYYCVAPTVLTASSLCAVGAINSIST